MELLRDDVGVLKDMPRSSLKAGKARDYILFSLNGEPLRRTFGSINRAGGMATWVADF